LKTSTRSNQPIASNEAEIFEYFRQSFAAPTNTLQPEDVQQDPSQCAEGSELNDPVTADEGVAAIPRLKRNKAVIGDLQLATLSAIGPYIAAVLASLFNAFERLQWIPDEIAAGAVVPILKPGKDATKPSSYRPITVGTVVAKLYATILNLRITAWAEAAGIRAMGQHGFRPGRRTTDAIFILHSIIEKQRQENGKLYTAFIDFEKAYDSVRRDLLWRKLEERGVTGGVYAASIKSSVCQRATHPETTKRAVSHFPIQHWYSTGMCPQPKGEDQHKGEPGWRRK